MWLSKWLVYKAVEVVDKVCEDKTVVVVVLDKALVVVGVLKVVAVVGGDIIVVMADSLKVVEVETVE